MLSRVGMLFIAAPSSSLRAAVIAKVRASCIWRESFMRILDYGPDSSPKLD